MFEENEIMTPLDSYKDCIGNDVKVGDVITYPGRSGSSLWMNFGKVTKITKKFVKNSYFGDREYTIVQVLRPIMMWHGLEDNKIEGWKKVGLVCIERHVKLFNWQNAILDELYRKEI